MTMAGMALPGHKSSARVPVDRQGDDHVLIIGTGFAGLGMAIALKRAGIDDFTILEQADEVGGTWRDNHYPGAACDVQSHLYSFSFEPNPGWTRQFAPQREILDYLIHCADKYDLRPHIRFRTKVTAGHFDERAGLWDVETAGGETFRARVVVSGCGGISRPSVPDIRGLTSFQGETFHTARWQDDVPLEGKRVAVIGTGASAVQVVPELAPRVAHLTVYQRTAPWIIPKPDYEIGKAARSLFRLVPAAQQVVRRLIYWQRETFATGFVVEPRLMKLMEIYGRKFLEESVADPKLRAKLLPDYRMGCKRILPTNDYYPALQRSHVEVVTEGIEEVRPRGILTKDGTEREFDAIVLATGFQAAEQLAPFAIRGRGGRKLEDAWRDGAEAFLGTTVSGFPNAFLIVGPNTGLGHTSMVFMIESQISYILSAIHTMRVRRLHSVDVRASVQETFNKRLHERLGKTIWSSGCNSWYKTRSGKNTTIWPGYTFEYRLRTRRFDPADYDVVSKDEPAVMAAQ